MIPDFLREVIEEAPNRKISYATFMNEVLYHPQFGYYMKENEKVGTKGDFLTSSNVSDVYGKLFARLLVRYFKETSITPAIYEIGGGTGRFARQLLEEVKRMDATFYKRLSYIIIETSPYHLALQKKAIPPDASVYFYSSLDELPARLEGIIFSNELFDAFPVHVIKKQEEQLYELFVTLNESGQLVEVSTPVLNSAILEYLSRFNLKLNEGQRLEVPLAMADFAHKMGMLLEKGTIITVDYGYTFSDLSMPELKDGSLRGYYHHQMVTNPLLHPGEMDLTTHIHLETLESLLDHEGCTHVLTKRQGEFLVAAGILEFLQENMDTNPFSETSKQNRAIRSLIMDSSWSNSFHIMVHEKNIHGWNTLIHAQ